VVDILDPEMNLASDEEDEELFEEYEADQDSKDGSGHHDVHVPDRGSAKGDESQDGL
jgi:hypothetical protein